MRRGPSFLGRRGYHHGRLKEALVEAARALVAERGEAGFTLAEAAKRAGVTAAAPYRHFSDRNALLGELAKRSFELFCQRLKGAWDEGRPDPVQALRRMGTAYLAFAREEPGLYHAMFGNAQALAPEQAAAARQSFDLLVVAAKAVLTHLGGASAGAHQLASEVWALAHGVAQLMLAGHFDARAPHCDPTGVLVSGAAGLVEAAVRRGGGRQEDGRQEGGRQEA
jgi:AcrR family transcriptional regulator